MRSIDDTNFPESIRENVPSEWREAVLAWVKLKSGPFIPSVYIDYDFIVDVPHTPLSLNILNPSHVFFRLIPSELLRAFRPGDAVSISFNAEEETVLFLGEGQWDLSVHKDTGTQDASSDNPDRSLLVGLWPGFEDFDL